MLGVRQDRNLLAESPGPTKLQGEFRYGILRQLTAHCQFAVPVKVAGVPNL